MSLGGDIDYATTVDNAAGSIRTGLDQLIKVLADPELEHLDQDRFIAVMQDLEQSGTGSR